MENSKKFRFNIIDAAVIVIILAVAAVFAFKFIDFGSSDAVVASVQYERISYVVQVDAMDKQMYEEVSAMLPTQLLSYGAYLEDGYVVSCEAVPCEVTDIEVKDGQYDSRVYHLAPSGEYYTVRFYCEAKTKAEKVINGAGSQEIRVGRQYFLKTKDMEFVGLIVSLEHGDLIEEADD